MNRAMIPGPSCKELKEHYISEQWECQGGLLRTRAKSFGAAFLAQPKVLDNLSLYCYSEHTMENQVGRSGMSPHGADDCQRPLVVVDVVIFTLRNDDLRVLLVRRKRSPQEGLWAIPGGALALDETLEAAALRTLEEQTGLADVYLEQLYTFGEPCRDPRGRVITVAYFAIVPVTDAVGCADIHGDRVRWWSIYDLPPVAFDHADILDYALTRLRYKLEYTAVGFELLPEEFTLPELQMAYEIVLGEKLDKRNFRRKILSAGVIEPSGTHRTGEGRPARLYRYREDAVAEVKARRLFP
jgi:8-oxo-dGTP diphosphatase